VSRLLRHQPPVWTVVVPQSTQHLPPHHVSHVNTDQPDDKHPVSPQIVLRKLREHARLPLGGVERAQVTPHVLYLTRPVERAEQPLEDIHDGHHRQEDVPEPDEDENLLVEEVDRQRALHDVRVHARLVTYRKLAECDAREPFRLEPVHASKKPLYDVRAVPAVLDAEEGLHEEQLDDGVGDVDELDGEVGRHEIVAVETATDEETDLRDEVFDSDAAAGAIFTL